MIYVISDDVSDLVTIERKALIWKMFGRCRGNNRYQCEQRLSSHHIESQASVAETQDVKNASLEGQPLSFILLKVIFENEESLMFPAEVDNTTIDVTRED
jgi:hypothetical protein